VFDGRDTIYLQIADQVRADVAAGRLGEEERVMSTTQDATTFRINPATAAKAFAELVDEGVLYKRRGVGMFVASGARERFLAERRERFFVDVVDPVAAEAAVLGIPPDAVVDRLRAAATPANSHTVAPATEGKSGSTHPLRVVRRAPHGLLGNAHPAAHGRPGAARHADADAAAPGPAGAGGPRRRRRPGRDGGRVPPRPAGAPRPARHQ
jgi:DNA-binding transcriptional regulator YhcF (GntR family)